MDACCICSWNFSKGFEKEKITINQKLEVKMNKITIEEVRKSIQFIEDDDNIEQVHGGYSGAYTYKIMKKGKQYFLKILKNKENAIQRINEIIDAYKKCDIDTVNLIDCGIIEKYDVYYCIYDWIDGIGLNTLIAVKDITYFYDIGKKVGEKLKLLKQLKTEIKYINMADKLSDKAEEWLNLLNSVPDEIVCRYFNKAELGCIKQKMIDYTKYFDEEDKCLIHTDIKLGNIMIKNEKIYIIDIEDMEYNYDVFNIICWPIGVFEDGKLGECNLAFQKGIFDVLVSNRENLDKQILFMYMANFCFATYGKYMKKQDLNQLALFKTAYDKTNKFTELKMEF